MRDRDYLKKKTKTTQTKTNKQKTKEERLSGRKKWSTISVAAKDKKELNFTSWRLRWTLKM